MTVDRERTLSVAFTPGETQDGILREATVAIVDVLRATSVIPQALAAGAVRVIPAASVEHATGLLATLDKKTTLLCGEREGRKIPGFHLGNSPLEYVPKVVKGKTLIFASTNGSLAMIHAQTAPEQVMASFVNTTLAVERLLAAGRDIVVICAGKEGRASLEDAAMAGLLVERVLDAAPGFVPDDGAHMARALWRSRNGDIAGLLRESGHGAYLATLGFEDDLEFCARLDAVPCVPVLRDGRIERDGDRDAQTRSQASR
jgi:2-phosphosulfolactate phosphatase